MQQLPHVDVQLQVGGKFEKERSKRRSRYGQSVTLHPPPDQTPRDTILVAVGDRVTAGQHIGNLLSQGDGAHVHFGLGGGCPLEQFSPSVAAQLEALYGSGIERRPELPNLCNTSGPTNA